jgi:hypothetical protein
MTVIVMVECPVCGHPDAVPVMGSVSPGSDEVVHGQGQLKFRHEQDPEREPSRGDVVQALEDMTCDGDGCRRMTPMNAEKCRICQDGDQRD